MGRQQRRGGHNMISVNDDIVEDISHRVPADRKDRRQGRTAALGSHCPPVPRDRVD